MIKNENALSILCNYGVCAFVGVGYRVCGQLAISVSGIHAIAVPCHRRHDHDIMCKRSVAVRSVESTCIRRVDAPAKNTRLAH